MKVLDIEVYHNYFLALFKDIETGELTAFEAYHGKSFDGKAAMRCLKESLVVTFNGNCFDLPLFGQACAGKSPAEIKALADKIILEDMKPWQLNIAAPECDHIDLIEVAPGQASLKIYGGRLHCKKMQDLPIAPDASISPKQRELLKQYCENDLDLTALLYRKLLPQIELRQTMSAEYGLDLRSKSDAQIAEAVITQLVESATGSKVVKNVVRAGTRYRYLPPPFVHFQTPELQTALARVRGFEFVVDSGGTPRCEALEGFSVTLGGNVYRMGKGGLHSSEHNIAHFADDENELRDVDVASYYPNLMLAWGYEPPQMKARFSEVFGEIVRRRLAAKAAGDKVTSESTKVMVNGSFGKLGSKYSSMYAPNQMIQVTVTGQLALLMLIEQLELLGIPVVSANTDGIVIKCPREKTSELDAVVWLWEFWTGLKTEAVYYRALYSRDVNNYLAIKTDNSVKTKGSAFANTSLTKSPTSEICVHSVIEFLKEGTPIEKTIRECADIRKFVSIRTVKGGAIWNGNELGKAVRWYYSTETKEPIRYKSNGNKVAKTDGAKPLMELPDYIPDDINFEYYEREAMDILNSIIATPRLI